MKSMTAFASRTEDTPSGQLIVELRTVNHRFLDVHIRLPEQLRVVEPELRKRIGAAMRRGRVDVGVYLERCRDMPPQLELDMELVRALEELAREVRVAAPDARAISVASLLRWPDVVQYARPDSEALGRIVLALFSETLTEVDAVRVREGRDIAMCISEYLDQVEDLAQQVTVLIPELESRFRVRVLEKLGETAQRVSSDALEREILQFLQKSDVSEEIDRLGIHMREARGHLDVKVKHKESSGRYLDFLMQEFHREATTLGAKSVDARVTGLSVKLRVLIERVREQVQNVE